MDTGIIGSVTVMKSYISDFGSLSATMHGLVVSAILIPAAISSSFAGRVADVLGRPKSIAIGALIFGLGAALEAGAVSIAMFVVGRIVAGIGEGLYLGTLVVQVQFLLDLKDERELTGSSSYICEISPPSQRGPLTAGPQLMCTLGLVIGFFICYGTASMDSPLAWRTPFIILACLSTMFVVASILWLVPSPRWLALRGRQAEASAAWDILGVSHTEREKVENNLAATGVEAHNLVDSVDANHRQSVASHIRTPGSTNKHRFLDVFARDVSSRTGLAVFLLGMQQLSGIDGVLYVSYIPVPENKKHNL